MNALYSIVSSIRNYTYIASSSIFCPITQHSAKMFFTAHVLKSYLDSSFPLPFINRSVLSGNWGAAGTGWNSLSRWRGSPASREQLEGWVERSHRARSSLMTQTVRAHTGWKRGSPTVGWRGRSAQGISAWGERGRHSMGWGRGRDGKTIYKMTVGSRFLTAGEGSCRYAKGKTRMNPLLLDWNWRYYSQFSEVSVNG